MESKRRLYYLQDPMYEEITEFALMVDMPMHIKITHDWTVYSASRPDDDDDDGCSILTLAEARRAWDSYIKRGFVRYNKFKP